MYEIYLGGRMAKKGKESGYEVVEWEVLQALGVRIGHQGREQRQNAAGGRCQFIQFQQRVPQRFK